MVLKKIISVILICIMMITAVFGSITPQPVYAETKVQVKLISLPSGDTVTPIPKIWLVENGKRIHEFSTHFADWNWASGNRVITYTGNIDLSKSYTIEAEAPSYSQEQQEHLYSLAQFNKWYANEFEVSTGGSIEEGFTVTTTPLSKINGTVSFVDEELPEKITVNLLKNGEVVDSIVTDASKEWKFDFGTRVKINEDGTETMYNTVVEDIPGHYHRTWGYDVEVVPMTKITLTKELIGESEEDEFGIYILPNYRSFRGLWKLKMQARYPNSNYLAWIGYSMAHKIIEGAKRWDAISEEEPLYPVVKVVFNEELTNSVLKKVQDNGGSIPAEGFSSEEINMGEEFVEMARAWIIPEGEAKYDITIQGSNKDPDVQDKDAKVNAGRALLSAWTLMMCAPFNGSEDWGLDPELTASPDELADILSSADRGDELRDFKEYIDRQVRNKLYFYTTIKPGETKVVELPIEHLYSLIIVENDHADTIEPEAINIVNLGRTTYPRDTEEELVLLRIGDYEATLTNKGTFTPTITNTTARVGESIATKEAEASYMLNLSEDDVELFDTIEFDGLDKDLIYTIKSTLYSDNKIVQSKLTEIKNQDSGSVEIKFDNKISEGTYDIKTEILLDNKVVFTHNNKLDTNLERVTITKQLPLPLPIVATSAEAQDENGLLPEKNQTIVDTVYLTNLAIGVEYTLTGELMNKSRDTEVEQYECDDYTFTAKATNETHKVTFNNIDATSLGGDKLVVFETLTWKSDVHGDTKEAKHDDINDEEQTVVVKRYPTIQIRKTDATTTEELIGAELVVTDIEGSIIDKWTSDGAVHIIENIKPGAYTLTENQAPIGYNVAESITFEVDENGIVGDPIEMKDAPYVEVSFTKRELGGEELEGATIQIIDSEGNVVEEWISTTEPHKIKLPDGEYIMHEEVAPEGYYVATDIPFTVDSKNAETTAKVDMADQRWGEVVISKVDATTSEELPGATLVLKDDKGNIIDEWESKEEPYRIHLEEGTYTLTEITAPDGYNVAETITFVVNREGLVEGEKVEMLDQPYTEVEFSKQNLNGEEIAGAELWIMDVEGNIVDKWTSEVGVSHKIKLPDGDYVMHEEVAPNGYFVATDIPFTVKAGTATNTTKVDMKDAPWPTVEISKIDATTSEELPGATLIVKDANGDTVKQWVSTEETYKIQLEPGEYTLTEITAPSGYEVAETISFTVDENGLVGSEKVVMKDTPKEYEVKINKTALNGKELAGATIRVTGENFEKEWASKENETMDIVILAGVYTLEEVVAPEGFDRVTTKVDFSVSKEGEVKILTTEVENGEIEYKNGIIVLKDRPSGVPLPFDEEVVISVVKKSDDDKKLPLKGAEITLFTEDGKVAKDTEGKDCIALTDENGEVKFKVFKSRYVGEEDEYGRVVIKQSEDIKYYIQETKAPEGYHINPNKFKVVYGEETEILDKVIVIPPAPQEAPKNEAPKSDAPKTGDTNNMTLYIILGLTSLSGVMVLLKKSRTKTKNYN